MSSHAHPRLDLLVVGMASSGTTLFANLLTNPAEGRLCLNEPRLTTRRGYKEKKQQYFRRLGATDPTTPAKVADFLFNQKRSGVKEIRARHIVAAVRRYNPKQIVLVVRDARAALVSYYEKNEERNSGQRRSRKKFPARLFVRTAPVMLRLRQEFGDRVVVVQYERFVQDADYRDQIAATLDWPLDGDLTIFDTQSRASSCVKHEGKISSRSLSRSTPDDPAVLRVLTPALRRLALFQSVFCYPAHWEDVRVAPPPRAEVVAAVRDDPPESDHGLDLVKDVHPSAERRSGQ